MTWAAFERGAKFLGAMVWATWELMIRETPSEARLVFIATVLAGSEAVRAIVQSREVDTP